MYYVQNITNERQVTPYKIFNAQETAEFQDSPVGDPKKNPETYFKNSPYFKVTYPPVNPSPTPIPVPNTGPTSEFHPELYLRKDFNLHEVEDPVVARRNLGFGHLVYVNTSRTLVPADDSATIIADGPITVTVPTGLGENFGCAFDGDVTFVGTATLVDIRDLRAYDFCVLVQVEEDTYKIVGGFV